MKKLPFIFNFYYLYSISLHLKHPALMSPGPWKYSSMETAASPKFTRLKKRTRLISWCSQLLVWANMKHVCWHFHSRVDITSSHYFLVNTPSSKTNTPNIPPDNHYPTSVEVETHDRCGHSIFITTFCSFEIQGICSHQSLILFIELFILHIFLNGFYTGSYFSSALY